MKVTQIYLKTGTKSIKEFDSIQDHFWELLFTIFSPGRAVQGKNIDCKTLEPSAPKSFKVNTADAKEITKLSHVFEEGNQEKDVDTLYTLIRKYPKLAENAYEFIANFTKDSWEKLERGFNSQPTLKELKENARKSPAYVQQETLEKDFHFRTAPEFLNEFVQDAAKGRRRFTSDQVLDFLSARGKCPKPSSEPSPATTTVLEQKTPTATAAIETTAAQQTTTAPEQKSPVATAATETTAAQQTTTAPEQKSPVAATETVAAQQTYFGSFLNGATFGGLITLKRGIVNSFAHRFNFSALPRRATQITIGIVTNYAITRDINFSVASAVIEEILNKVIANTSSSLALMGSSLLYNVYYNNGLHALANMAGSTVTSLTTRVAMRATGLNIDEPQPTTAPQQKR